MEMYFRDGGVDRMDFDTYGHRAPVGLGRVLTFGFQGRSHRVSRFICPARGWAGKAMPVTLRFRENDAVGLVLELRRIGGRSDADERIASGVHHGQVFTVGSELKIGVEGGGCFTAVFS